MELTLFLKLLVEYGTGPAVLALAGAVLFLIKKVNDNGSTNAKRAADFRKAIEDISRQMAEHSDRLTAVEKDSVRKDELFQALGGWRSEIDYVRRDVQTEMRSLREEIANFRNCINGRILEVALKGVDND